MADTVVTLNSHSAGTTQGLVTVVETAFSQGTVIDADSQCVVQSTALEKKESKNIN